MQKVPVASMLHRFPHGKSAWDIVGIASMYEPLKSSGMVLADLVNDDPRLTQAMNSVELVATHPDRFHFIRYNEENTAVLISPEYKDGDTHYLYRLLSYALLSSTIMRSVSEASQSYVLPRLGERRQPNWEKALDEVQELHRLYVMNFHADIENPATSDHFICAYHAGSAEKVVLSWIMLNGHEVYFFENDNRKSPFDRHITIPVKEYMCLRRLSRKEIQSFITDGISPEEIKENNVDFMFMRLRALALESASKARRIGGPTAVVLGHVG